MHVPFVLMMGKLGELHLCVILLVIVLLVCNNVQGAAVQLTAILPISKDINAPLHTAQVITAIELGVNASNQQQIINSAFGVTLTVQFR